MTYHVQILLLVLAGWINRQQQDVIDYLREENLVLRAGLRGKRLRLSDNDRRRLAVKAQALGREVLAQIASVACAFYLFIRAPRTWSVSGLPGPCLHDFVVCWRCCTARRKSLTSLCRSESHPAQ